MGVVYQQVNDIGQSDDKCDVKCKSGGLVKGEFECFDYIGCNLECGDNGN